MIAMEPGDSALLAALVAIILIITVSRSIQVFSPPVPVSQIVSLFAAVERGRSFLDDNNHTTGRILSTALEVREPNFYWSTAMGMEKPNSAEPRLMWIIRFEQANRPGHFFEVWVAERGMILGGNECL
jgi:hypothetical protein